MRQPIYGESIRVRTPVGFTDAVNVVARQSHTTASEFIRRVVLREIEGAGVRLPSPAYDVSEQAGNR